MILNDVAFSNLEELVDNSWRDIEYIVVHFEFNKDETKVIKYFAPIFVDEKTPIEKIHKLFHYYVGFIVYDKNKFITNSNDIFPTVKKVLSRKVAKDTYNLIFNNLENSTINYNDYTAFINSSKKFIDILSDTLISLQILKSFLKQFDEYDIHFLTENQIRDIAIEHSNSEGIIDELEKKINEQNKKDADNINFKTDNPNIKTEPQDEPSREKQKVVSKLLLEERMERKKNTLKSYKELSKIKQKQFINDNFTPKNNKSIIQEMATKNISNTLNNFPKVAKTIYKILESYNFEKLFNEVFFLNINEEKSLKLTTNMLTDNIKNELFKIFYKTIQNDTNKPIHGNASIFYKEIIREIKFINLYAIDNDYSSDSLRNAYVVEELYEKMNNDKLGGFRIYEEESHLNKTNKYWTYIARHSYEIDGIEQDIKYFIEEEIEHRIQRECDEYPEAIDFLFPQSKRDEMRQDIENHFLDKYNAKSLELVISLNSEDYKSLTKRDKERLKKRINKAVIKRAKLRTNFRKSQLKKEAKLNSTHTETFNIKVKNKATD